MPFGSLNFTHFLAAADHLRNHDDTVKDIKNIVIMTNDHEWARNESMKYSHTDWKFSILPQPPPVRGSSVNHGVHNLGDVEMVQQCSALIGHFGSAFTSMVYQFMCFKHGPSDVLSYGVCPSAFDFNTLRNV